jgi:hypothetical protein
MRKILFLFIFLPLISEAQSTVKNDVSVSYTNITSNWVEIFQQDGIIFYATKTDCNHPEDGIYQEMIFLKLVNTTSVNLIIEWDLQLWYDDQLWTRLPPRSENHKIMNVVGGEQLVCGCDSYSDYYISLAIFSKFLNYQDKPELTKFEFSNIKISPYAE